MAFQIQGYDQSREIGGGSKSPSVAPNFINTGVGREIQSDAGDALSAWNHIQHQQAQSGAIAATSNLHLDVEKAFQTAKEQAKPGAPDFTNQMLKYYDAQVDTIAKSLPDDATRKVFRDHAMASRDNYGARFIGWEGSERQRNRVDNFSKSTEADANSLMVADANSRAAMYASQGDAFNQSIDAMELEPGIKQQLKDENRNRRSWSAVQGDLRDRPDKVQDWLVHPQSKDLAPGTPNSYFAALKSAESGGDPTAQAKTSSAYGPYQFTVDAWQDTISHHPELGFSAADRTDPQKQEAAARVRQNDLNNILKAQGLPLNPVTAYMTWFLGPAGGPRFIKGLMADPNQDARNLVSPEAAAANPSVFNGRSAGDVFKIYQKKFGNVANDAITSNNTPTYYSDLTPEKRDSLYTQAENEMNKRRIQGEAALAQQAQNSIAEYQATGTATNAPTQEQFVAGYGVQRGLIKAGEFQANAQSAAAQFKLQRMPLAEGEQFIETLRPKEGDPFFAEKLKGYMLAKQAGEQIHKQMIEDFGQHVVNINPEARAALQLAMTSTDPNEAKDAANRYSQFIDAEGQRLGIPASRRAFLPKTFSNEISAQLAQKFTKDAQASAVVDALNSVKTRWGDAWPRIYSELQTNLSAPAQVITSGIQPQAAQILAANHDKSYEDLSKTLDKSSRKYLESYLQQSFAQASATTNWQASSVPIMSNFYEQGKKLAAVYMGQGMDEKAAATKAYDDLIGFKYRMTGQVRIPKAVDSGDLESKMKQEFSNIVKSDALMPGDYEKEVLGVDKSKAMLESWLTRNGRWVTLPDDSGVGLYVGNGGILRDGAGNQIKRTWDQLRGVDIESTTPLPPLHPGRQQIPFSERAKQEAR